METLKAVDVTPLNATVLAKDGAAGLACLRLDLAHCLKNTKLLGFLEKGVVQPRLRQ